MLKQSGSGRSMRSKEGFRFHVVFKTGLALAVTIWLIYQLKHLLNHHKQTTSQAATVGETVHGLEDSRMAVTGGGGALKFGRKGLKLPNGEMMDNIEKTNGVEIKEERVGDIENNGEQQKHREVEEDEELELERIEDLVDAEDKVDAEEEEEEDDGNEEERAIEQLDFQAEEVDSDFLDRASI